MGHTDEVNEKNYTYDMVDMEYRRELLKKAQDIGLSGNVTS